MVCFRMLLIVALVFRGHVTALPENITIGGIFDISSATDEAIFHYAVDHINQQSNLLPGSTVMGQTERVNLDDSFHTSKKVCEFLGDGIISLVSPSSPKSAPQVRSICEAKEVPHIEVGMVFKGSSSINLFPHPSSLAKAYSSVVQAMGWQDYLILYEDINRLTHLQKLLVRKDVKVTVRKLFGGPNGTSNDYRSLLKEIKLAGHHRIVLDCSSKNIPRILSHAQQVGMLTEYQSYLITNLDLHTVNLEDFKYEGARITALRLVNSYNETQQTAIQEQLHDKVLPMQTEAAVIYDSLLLWAKALTSLARSKNIEISTLDCETEGFLEYGRSLINFMKMEESVGLTGRIKLNDFGFRTDFDLEIVELKTEGLRKMGFWNPTHEAQFYTQVNKRDITSRDIRNKMLIVSTILNAPFCMRKEIDEIWVNGTCNRSFEECYEGYTLDLVKELAKEAKFRYTFKLVSDGQHGQYDEKKQQWSGLIGELESQKADLAVADMVITSEREQVIDFTTPFMNTGITILYQKEHYVYSTNIFSYLTTPFGLDLWLCILAAYFIVSLVFFIIARFNPVEKDEEESSSSSRSKDSANNANGREAFTAMNSFWFILASGLAQRVDFLPRAFSTRVVAAFWWFFVIMTISAYLANLVAFQNFVRPLTEIEKIQDVSDLASQNRVKYGAVKGGSTEAFFRDSKSDIYNRIWAGMTNNENVFMKNFEDGKERVSKESGKYAFFAESTVVDYVRKRWCDFKKVGGLLDSKSYGIGLPKDSPYYEPINRALLQLQEKGHLRELKFKWWEWERGGGACRWDWEYTGYRTPSSLDSDDLGGLFVLLLVGILLACVIACGECMAVWWKKRGTVSNSIPMSGT